jgi:hypothetical protein
MRKRFVLLGLVFVLFFGIAYLDESNFNFNFKLTWFKGSKQDPNSPFIIPPDSELSLSKEDMSNHWATNGGYFVLVAEDTCKTYVAAQEKSPHYKELTKTQRVRVLYEKSQPVDVDGQLKTWVFLSDIRAKQYLGWTYKECLAFPHQFKEANNFSYQQISYQKGTFSVNIKSKKPYYFILNWNSEGQGVYMQGSTTGKWMHYEGLYWAKKAKQDFAYEFFYEDKEGKLLLEFEYETSPVEQNVYTLEPK